jgi:hypothetical protein
MRKVLLLISFLFISNYHLNAQALTQNQRVWFAYSGQYKVSQNWGYHIEAQFRMDNQLEQNLQNLYRIGAVYFISPSKNVTSGYALINTFDGATERFFKENRLWEQFQYTKKWRENKNAMTHRLRLEQRWVGSIGMVDGNPVSTGSNYQNRLRYLNRNLFHITNLKATDEEIYAVLQNEVFITVGDNKVNSNIFDQNRFLIGLGLNYNNHIRLEVGYMNHFVNANAKADVMNHTVSISLIQSLNLQKQ